MGEVLLVFLEQWGKELFQLLIRQAVVVLSCFLLDFGYLLTNKVGFMLQTKVHVTNKEFVLTHVEQSA